MRHACASDALRASARAFRSCTRLIRRRAGRAARHGDRHGKADADKEILLGRIDQPGDDADHLAVAIQQRAARIAGIHGGVDLNQVLQL